MLLGQMAEKDTYLTWPQVVGVAEYLPLSN